MHNHNRDDDDDDDRMNNSCSDWLQHENIHGLFCFRDHTFVWLNETHGTTAGRTFSTTQKCGLIHNVEINQVVYLNETTQSSGQFHIDTIVNNHIRLFLRSIIFFPDRSSIYSYSKTTYLGHHFGNQLPLAFLTRKC